MCYEHLDLISLSLSVDIPVAYTFRLLSSLAPRISSRQLSDQDVETQEPQSINVNSHCLPSAKCLRWQGRILVVSLQPQQKDYVDRLSTRQRKMHVATLAHYPVGANRGDDTRIGHQWMPQMGAATNSLLRDCLHEPPLICTSVTAASAAQ